MIKISHFHQCIAICIFIFLFGCTQKTSEQKWTINDREYLEKPGLSILVFHNFYSGGKQGGIEIEMVMKAIQAGRDVLRKS